MPIRSVFLDKLIDRLDRVDPESLQAHFLHLAQERGLLETIFQSIQEGVLVMDSEGKLSYANRAAGSLLGFNPETATGRPITRYMREIDWDRILDFDEGDWSKLITREIEITYPEHRYVSFYVVPLSADDIESSGVVVILRDVTKDRLQEASVLESERLNAVKLLAAGVAHEIGNPLNALNIHLQLLDREMHAVREDLGDAASPPPTPEALAGEIGELQELVDVARNEVSRLDLIITQFLRAIRPANPVMVATQIQVVLEEALTLLRHEVTNRGIDIEIVSPSPVPEIQVDRDQIKQAFFNLIKNAFQAMPDGGSLQISLRCSDEFLEVAFQDTGVGINPEDLGQVFEPYHTSKSTGSGLGLMIVQRIVQEHGGHIELMSKPNEGTRLTLHLPLSERRIRLLTAADDEEEKYTD
ncbi:MAG: PAS domain-containing protein [Verrucomicrobia bacterium]|jgi:two-component system, sporulation sensor kinase E|nr:PAS domain-containing protein [Verrucomicrobiota bacterium]